VNPDNADPLKWPALQGRDYDWAYRTCRSPSPPTGCMPGHGDGSLEDRVAFMPWPLCADTGTISTVEGKRAARAGRSRACCQASHERRIFPLLWQIAGVTGDRSRSISPGDAIARSSGSPDIVFACVVAPSISEQFTAPAYMVQPSPFSLASRTPPAVEQFGRADQVRATRRASIRIVLKPNMTA
jgi:hypothetical protein